MGIIKVPIELRDRFLADRANFIRDIAACPLDSISPFFKRKGLIDKSIDFNRMNPYNEQTMTLEDFEIVNPDAPRFLHFDLAYNGDCLGIACCHAHHFVERVVKTGQDSVETRLVPYLYFDFVARITARKNEEIDLNDAVDVIYQLTEKEIYIALTTFDRFQSVAIIQNLRREGFNTAILSIDRTAYKIVIDKHHDDGYKRVSTKRQYMAPMQCIKDSIYQGRASIPFHPYFSREAKAAEHDQRAMKVTHNPRNTIDLLQAVAGSAYNCENNTFPPDTEEFGTGETQQYSNDLYRDRYAGENHSLNNSLGDSFYKEMGR